jgi:putative transposase
MLKNHNLAKSIQSASWSEFVRQLTYKSVWYGKNVIFIGRFEPSSKTCSNCGYVKHDLTLNDRKWECPHCKTYHDRDINAAKNIKNFALNNYNGP